jgi:hypothetical protein
MSLFAHWMSRYAPKSTKRNVVRGGCLILFPFITLLVWLVQAIFWLMIGAPIFAYAIVMACMGGGFHRGVIAETAPPPV